MVLKNPRWERFAQLLAQGKYATDAHEEVGYKRHDSNASKLARKLQIQARVSEIIGKVAQRTAVTLESLIEQADEIRRLSVADKQYSAAMSAVREMGVLSGNRIERKEQGLPGEFADLENMSRDELREYFRAGAEAVGLCIAPAAAPRGNGKARSELN